MQVPIGSQLARITRRSTLRAALMFSKDTSKAPESEIRIAILLLGQRPPRAVLVVGRSCSIAEAISWEGCSCDFIEISVGKVRVLRGGSMMLCVCITKREKAESEAKRGMFTMMVLY